MIGDSAFKGCSGFTGCLKIPDSVIYINSSAFEGCGNISDIFFMGDAPSVCEADADGQSFGSTVKLHYRVSASKWYGAAGGKWNGYDIGSFSDFGRCGDSAYWKLGDDGILTIFGSGAMYDYEYNVKSGVHITTAPWGKYTDKFTVLVIEDGITKIGRYAFIDCGGFAGSLAIPDSVTSIGECAFFGCGNIGDIYFMGNAPSVSPADDSFPSFDNTVTLHYSESKPGWEHEDSEDKWNEYYIEVFLADDLNGDGNENISDAVFLMWYALKRTGYCTLPVYAFCDYNGDNAVNASDAVYLLWHVFYPEEYPIS